MPSALGLGLAVDLGRAAPCVDPPTITQQPPPTQYVNVGNPLVVTARFSGCGIISRMWQRRLATDPPGVFADIGSGIVIGDQARYETIAVALWDQSEWRCVFTNLNGSVTSNVQLLTVAP